MSWVGQTKQKMAHRKSFLGFNVSKIKLPSPVEFLKLVKARIGESSSSIQHPFLATSLSAVVQ